MGAYYSARGPGASTQGIGISISSLISPMDRLLISISPISWETLQR